MSDDFTMRQLRKLLRLTMPTPRLLRNTRLVKESGLFDADFYRKQYPDLHPICRAFPICHYLLYGEKLGLQPSRVFSPKAYLQYNFDLRDQVRSPLMHYIQNGQFENRITHPLPDVPEAQTFSPPAIRVPRQTDCALAIVVHVFYLEVWDEIVAILRDLPYEYDLFVDIVHHGLASEKLLADIKREFPDAVAFLMPNQGRDIFPFIHLLNSGALDKYSAVCKLHTKKSPHRKDGEAWRQHLIAGVLGEGTATALDNFLADHDAAIWVADGQHFTETKWWGSNRQKTRMLMHRLELDIDDTILEFPAGSVYWLKPVVISMLRGMRLKQSDFDREAGQLDGTTAHAVERSIGYIVRAAGLKVRQTSELTQRPKLVTGDAPAYVSAFYLPQFHPIPENDSWWGKGFTEWRNVVTARPQFDGHAQPQLPGDLGFYDLRVTEVMAEQARLAAAAGVDAFCVYHYIFDGGARLLENPLERLLENPGIAFPFYLCWANESWRRNWDGLSGEVLIAQSYLPGFEKELVSSTLPYMRDPRYVRPDGNRPRFVIYRPEDLPNPTANIAAMRQAWRDAGIGEVELGGVLFHVQGDNAVAEDDLDFWVEMPPHGFVKGEDFLFGGQKGDLLQVPTVPGFNGLVYDYQAVIENSLRQRPGEDLPDNTIAGIMPCWDNTARRGASAHIAWGGNPATFLRWLNGLARKRVPTSYRNEVMINSWNEWAERAMIEPSEQYGSAYLRCFSGWRSSRGASVSAD